MAVKQINLAIASKSGSNSFGPRTSGETFALACGIAFVVLLLTSLFIGPEPMGADTPAAQVAETYISHYDAALVQIYLRSFTALLMFVFVTGLAHVARRAEGRFSLPGMLAIGSALAFSLVMLISNMMDAAAALLANRGTQAEIVGAINSLGDAMRHLNGITYAFVLGTTSVALLRARVIPRFICWLGLAGVPLFLVAGAGFPATRLETVNLAALPFLPMLTLLQSITLLVYLRRVATR